MPIEPKSEFEEQCVQVIEDGQSVLNDLKGTLGDPNMQVPAKQVYFMDNGSKIKDAVKKLDSIIEVLNEKVVEGFEDTDVIAPNIVKLFDAARTVANDIKKIINDFRKALAVSSDVTDEHITPVINEEAVRSVAKNNSVANQVILGMNGVSETEFPYTHVLVYDGQTALICAETKAQLNEAINSIAETGSYTDIKLFAVSASNIPLKQKTILSV